ncbi:hypothetical protein C497_06674 [Halalkalicoccus jeotgali B3]|uniref:Uncharacterized protein n=1 Tax=Halalkalicoccus jeotgali (strain DSM 18796 / CECT 7217 / JCM 14584 / KCTC 4019 / B3) TaxID=795797 RepID=D8JC54_HALJB|nr:hypothetical protein HacjB3_18093 [Halalkalicoccus jeotgali B3]ADJ16992.1 hypothetical protein HacjB3_18248 [Halalkalicoccus jeotgali B3]ELY38603.1 hypothetical protein C497_06674 [Halalkalicoccus jeotgali B3]
MTHDFATRGEGVATPAAVTVSSINTSLLSVQDRPTDRGESPRKGRLRDLDRQLTNCNCDYNYDYDQP